jgi:hypothetical protein
VTTCFELPEFDGWTHRRLLPKSALRDGLYYIGRCQNASVARWNARQQCFYHWTVEEKVSAAVLLDHRCPIPEAEPYGDMMPRSHRHYDVGEQWRKTQRRETTGPV